MSLSNTPVCPCCGAPVDDGDLLVDESRNIVARGGITFQMTRQEFRLFSVLLRRRPAAVTRDSLLDAMMDPQNADDAPTGKILDVVVCHIRHELARMGVKIETHWGVGYGLRVGDIPVDGDRESVRDVQRRRSAWTKSDADLVQMLKRQGYFKADIAFKTNLRLSAIDTILSDSRSQKAVAA